MLQIAEAREDTMGRYQNSVYLGDVQAQIKTLVEAGQYSLAYLSAKTHNLEEEALEILQHANVPEPNDLDNYKSLNCGPHIIERQKEIWPLVVNRNTFNDAKVGNESKPIKMMSEGDLKIIGDWGDEDIVDELKEPLKTLNISKTENDIMDVEQGWDVDVDHIVADDEPQFAVPAARPSVPPSWVQSNNPCDHICAGSFKTAIKLLQARGIVNYEPLRSYFKSLYQSNNTFLPTITAKPLVSILKSAEGRSVPLYTVSNSMDLLDHVYPIMTQGK